MTTILKKLGPGLLFAGAAIGVSHLVQSTKAGADFGLGLIWALVLVNLFKYPFFQFGPRYALATGESLLDGYKKLGKGILICYYLLTFATMFTIQTAVTIVTAGLAYSLFGSILSIEMWTVVILIVCLLLLIIGRYNFLDHLMKIIIIVLTISTLVSVTMALYNVSEPISFTQIFPKEAIDIGFLIAFMGWMPAPLDISVWHSLWAIEKNNTDKKYNSTTGLFDFNIGYFATLILGLCFVFLGYLIMFNQNETFSNKGGEFANQLIDMYTSNLGSWAYIIIAIAAFTTMFSTTLTTLDASPRAMHKTSQLLFNKSFGKGYVFWVSLLAFGTIVIFFVFASEMGLLIKIATILSFLTAPFYAIMNYILICSEHTPKKWRPSKKIHILSWLGILFLLGFCIWYITLL
ncbi:Nramp family divalent metal transporter [Flavobacteriaceae bacterium]|jgi:Mn2+/Fe2+ NRAMP family transporter|nr:Nramp family divalent metal transporter [Flavobacteriaceae bacterium]